jgi:hypothetical protein
MNWEHKEGDFTLTVPILMWKGDGGEGTYEIHIGKRPHYCDRGDWIIWVEGNNDLDGADGFPRYFFGSEEQAKQQMETWLSRRIAYRLAKTKGQ